MLIGRYDYNIDVKGRISIPSKMREDLGAHFVATKGLDNCIQLLPIPEWERLMAKVAAQPYVNQHKYRRFFCEKSQDIELDKQGRFCIPPALREFAGLTDNVAIIGMENMIEIWSAQRWEEANSELTTENIESIMQENGF